MLKFFEEQYNLFISQPIISNSKHCREITAAYLHVLTDYALCSREEQAKRRENAQEIFNLLETKILTNEELVRFDKAVDLFGQVIRGEIRVRGDWCFLDEEVSNGLKRVFLCYGDLIYNPDYIEDYKNSPILISGIDLVMDFTIKFMEIDKLSLNYISKCNKILDKQQKEDEANKAMILFDISSSLKEILPPVKFDEDFLIKNIEFCYMNMSVDTLKELKYLLVEYLNNYSILTTNNGYCIDILTKIANIFYDDGHVHKSPVSEINGRRIHFQYKTELYTAAMLYERIALMGDYKAYLKAASCCRDMGFYHVEELKTIEKGYYNRAAENGVLQAFGSCDYMPEVFDKLINEKGPKYYLSYFFAYYRHVKPAQCKKYLDLIKEKCTEDEKKEIIETIKWNTTQEDKLVIIQYLNNEINEYKPKIERVGCYIATCVYGSYDCPEVWTLRRYRDNMLGSSWYGRAFIKLYYAISPTIVKWFGKTKWFKKMWKNKLDKMVKKLNNSGVDNTSYQDKKW